MTNSLQRMDAAAFLRDLRRHASPTNSFAFFLGAGCSITSGIPAVSSLVKDIWLPRLRDVHTPRRKDLEKWTEEKFPGHKFSEPTELYGPLLESLFANAQQRQAEMERLCKGHFPGFGYATLASLMTSDKGFNTVLTTNFDDLVAEAIYLFTNSSPLVIPHEKLARYVRPSHSDPLIVKLHGDHRLAPLNTVEETQSIESGLREEIKVLLHDRGLIFIGYGGNDQGICNMLEALSSETLPQGVYWVGAKEPRSARVWPWLVRRRARWVQSQDFDAFMLLTLAEFGLRLIGHDRFDTIFHKYVHTYQNLSRTVTTLPHDSPDAQDLRLAVERADRELEDWWSVEVAAGRMKQTEPNRVAELYTKGLKEYPRSARLRCNFADYLVESGQDIPKAEALYQDALELAGTDAFVLSSYARFLGDTKRNQEAAERNYKLALDHDPKNAHALGSYAVFLSGLGQNLSSRAKDYFDGAIRADPDNAGYLSNYAIFLNRQGLAEQAGDYYQRAANANPRDARALGQYATFLADALDDDERAEDLYRRAQEAEPSNVINLGSFAGFLLRHGRQPEGMSLLHQVTKLLETASPTDYGAEFWYYALLYGKREERPIAVRNLRRILGEGVRSPHLRFSPHLKQLEGTKQQEYDWLERVAKVIRGEADPVVLDSWGEWTGD